MVMIMETYFNGRIIGYQKSDFIGNEGQQVIFFTYHIKQETPQGEIFVINSGKDFSEFENDRAIFAIRLRSEGKLYKASLVGVTLNKES